LTCEKLKIKIFRDIIKVNIGEKGVIMTSQAQEKPAGAARKDPGLAKSRKAGKRGAKSSSQVLY